MTLEKYVEQVYPIECNGRNARGEHALCVPVNVRVKIYKSPDSNMISSIVECKYNKGSHGEECSVTKLSKEKVNCPYSFDLPYALEMRK